MRRTAGERGDQAGCAHHPGALDRRPGAGERHVEGHQSECEHEPSAKADPEHRARRQDQRRQQHHILAADREDVREAGPLELVTHALVQSLVLPQHHAAQQRRLLFAKPARQPSLGAAAGGVDEAGEAAAPLAGQP